MLYKVARLVLIPLLWLLAFPEQSLAAPSGLAVPLYNYFLAKYGVANPNLTIVGTTTSCPPGQRCLSFLALTTYTNGDIEGEALISISSRGPGYDTVLIAGGGQINDANIESFGYSAAAAKLLTGQ